MMSLHSVITATSFLVPVVGAGLLAALGSTVLRAYQKTSLQRHRSKDTGFADLLLYASVVHPGVIVNKNGSFMAAWRFTGADHASSTAEHREYVAAQVNAALATRDAGWMLHVNATRVAAPSYSDAKASHFPDAVSAAIDGERRRLFDGIGQLFDGEYVLTLTWFPPLLIERRFIELMFDDDAAPATDAGRMSQLLAQFERECETVETRLSTVLQLQRLRGRAELQEDGRTITYDDFLAHLNECVTGERHPIVLPSTPTHLDSLIGGREVWTGVVPRIGRKFVQVVAIDGFPNEATPGILNVLTELPVEYRWSTRFIFMDNHEAEKQLEKYRRKWKQKVRGVIDQVMNNANGRVDEHAQSMVRDADAAIAVINSGYVKQGYYTSNIVLMDENRDRLAAAARLVEKQINALGFSARIETLNTMDAFMGSLPGHGVENVRRPPLHTGNLCDLLPTSSIWCGETKAPCPLYPPEAPPLMHCVTDGYTPFRFNLHVRDLGHAIVLGPTRSGKSTLVGLIAAQFRRYRNARVIGFDKGMSLYPICSAVGGRHYVIEVGDKPRLVFSPFQFLATPSDRAWALEWVDQILTLNNVTTTPAQRRLIGEAIDLMHHNGMTRFSNLVSLIQDNSVRDALLQYTTNGLMGDLLDAEQDGLDGSDFVIFEIEKLMSMGSKYVLPVLLYLFRRIETSLDGRPTLIPLDECWIMLDHPVFRDKIREWLKAFAKKNVSVLMSTQSLSDAARSGIMDVITESTATKIFLPNMYARGDEASALYAKMGLNERQISMIAAAEAKRDYYYVSERGRRMFQLALGPVALSFVGATDPDSIGAIQKLEADHGRSWPAEWLNLRGVNANFSR